MVFCKVFFICAGNILVNLYISYAHHAKPMTEMISPISIGPSSTAAVAPLTAFVTRGPSNRISAAYVARIDNISQTVPAASNVFPTANAFISFSKSAMLLLKIVSALSLESLSFILLIFFAHSALN